MNKRSDIVAFQMVHNYGFDEALDMIQTKIDFVKDDEFLLELRTQLENPFSFSSYNHQMYARYMQHLSLLEEIKEKILATKNQ